MAGVSYHGHRARRAWVRSSCEYSRSFPAVEGALPTLVGLSTSMDADALGAYHQNFRTPRSPVPDVNVPMALATSDIDHPAITETSESTLTDNRVEITTSPQRSCSSDVSSLTNQGFEGDAKEVIRSTIIDVDEAVAEALFAQPVEQHQTAVVPVVVADAGQRDDNDNECGKTLQMERTSCACEGACGCANDNVTPVYEDAVRPRRRRRHEQDRSQLQQVNDEENKKTVQEIVQQMNGESNGTAKNTSDSDATYPKSAIIKLLGSSKSTSSKASQNCSLNSTTVSTASSTPSGSIYGRSFAHDSSSLRKISIRSKDSHFTRISMISSSYSSEMLHDEFEIVSESASILGTTSPNTPTSTPRFFGNYSNNCRRASSHRRRRRRRPSLPYSSCDLDSLYESIQALDNFIAKRSMSMNQARNQSVAVMLFGTPEHTRGRGPSSSSSYYHQEPNESTGFINGSKSWRSSDDAFSN